MTGNGNYVNWKTREIVSGELIFGGFLSLGTNVCCKVNLVCSDWEAAAWCCWMESRIKRKREKAAIPQMRKFKLFFFVFQATLLQSQLTRSLRSSTSSFQCWLRRRRHCTASVKRHHFLYQPHMRARANAVLYFWRRRRLAVHCHYGLCTVSDFSLEKK